MSRGLKWGIGIAVFIVLGLVGIQGSGLNIGGMNTAPQIQAKLQEAADNALKASGHEWAQVKIDGQRATIEGKAPTEEARSEAEQLVLGAYGIGGTWNGGVTRVLNLAIVETEGPYLWRVSIEDNAAVLSGMVPSEVARNELVRAAKRYFPEGVADQQEINAEGAPSGNWLGAAQIALDGLSVLDSGEAHLNEMVLNVSGRALNVAEAERHLASAIAGLTDPFVGFYKVRPVEDITNGLTALDADGPITQAEVECQDRLNQAVAGRSVVFHAGTADLAVASFELLNEVAAVMISCPVQRLEVAGHMDGLADEAENEKISQDRADAVVAYLLEKGVNSDKVTATGYGSLYPIAESETPAGRALNRRIEFRVKHSVQDE